MMLPSSAERLACFHSGALAGQRLSHLPCASATASCCSSNRRPRPAAKLQLMARRRASLAAAASEPPEPSSLDAFLPEDVLPEGPLPEEQGMGPAYPGDAVSQLRDEDVRTWRGRMQEAVHPIVRSLKQQTLVLALAEQLHWEDAGEGAKGGAAAALHQQQFVQHAAMLDVCCERLRCAAHMCWCSFSCACAVLS